MLKKEVGSGSGISGFVLKKQKAKKECLHKHYMEIIVSKKEMLDQLCSFAEQDNLLKLFVYEKEPRGYELLLQKVSLKFEIIGSFVYQIGNRTKKFSEKTYRKIRNRAEEIINKEIIFR